ncbi:MAG: hypothetical protein ACT4PJ_17195 [Gemmatimonadaceae bacterium]
MTITEKWVRAVVGGAAMLVAAACSTDLEITNPNNPDIERALRTPEDVQNIAISTINNWYLASTHFEPYMMLSVTADALTANFGNFGMRFNNLQPRIAYGNNSAGGDRGVAEEPWEQNYSTIGSANDVLRAIRVQQISLGNADSTAKYEHLAMFSRAASVMNIALIFDRGFVVNEVFQPGVDPNPELLPFEQVADTALKWFEELITATTGKSYTYAASVLPMASREDIPGSPPLTSAKLNRIANTMAALLLAYTPRRAADVPGVDWAKVRALADKGIGQGSAGAPLNIVVDGDGGTNWYSFINYYGNEPSWTRTDMRLINRMDPSQPAVFTGAVAPVGSSPDDRYTDDYQRCPCENTGTVIGDPGRGIYMQSYFAHKRYRDHSRLTSGGSPTTPVPYLLAAESDLVLAEALIRTGGDKNLAATLINNTRVTRGGLSEATGSESNDVLLGHIDYERDIELLNTNGFDHFRRRHVDGLQPGTVRHLPIPAKELETLQLPIYTFGGVGQPDM